MQGLILGISNGTACLFSCAPVLLPYLMGREKSVKDNAKDLVLFLTGRLLGYVMFGVIAWFTNMLLTKEPEVRELLMGMSYISLGTVLFYYNIAGRKRSCSLKTSQGILSRHFNKDSSVYPSIFGFITGINICPTFLLVFTEAVGTGSMAGSILFFITFFIGTSLYFIPFTLISKINKSTEIKTIGELVLYIISAFYVLKGILILGGLL